MVTRTTPDHQSHATRASVAAKSRDALDSTHGLCLTLSPEAFRDCVLCPAIAAQLGTTPGSLCPACGTGGAVSLKGLITDGHVPTVNLTSVSATFTAGSIVLAAYVSSTAPGARVAGEIHVGFDLNVGAVLTLSIVGGKLIPAVAVTKPSLSLHFSPGDVHLWWAHSGDPERRGRAQCS